MEIKKVNLDRLPVHADHIRSRQDFQQVLNAYRRSVNPVSKQPLFYGVVGFASIASAVFISLVELNDLDENYSACQIKRNVVYPEPQGQSDTQTESTTDPNVL